MAIPVLQDAKLRLTDCIYFGDAIAEATFDGVVPNGSITLVKLAAEVTAVALGGAAAVHTHVGLLSGILTGYIPVGNDATSLVNGPLFSDGVSVGLGTDTPSDALHVRRSGSRSALFLDGQGAGGYAALKIECAANTSAFLVAAGYVDGDGGLPSGAGFSIRDTNANSDRLVIYNDGTVNVTGSLSENGTQVSVVGHTHANTDITGLGTMSVQNANAVAITGGSASGLTSLSAGSVTATGLTPGALVVAGTGGLLADSDIYTDGTYVGIGVTEPAAKLDVDGDIKAASIKLTTGAAAGYVLTSDADGDATWQAFTGGMTYKGTWDANTNTPTLADGVGTAGDTYAVTVGGTQFTRTFTAGGWAIYNGSIWEPVGTSVSVTSVNGLTGAVSLALASSAFANQGTATTVLHGNAAGNPSWSAVSLSADVSGTLPLANGGTGQTTAQAAMNALAGGVTSGRYLRGDGANVALSTIQAADVPTLNQNTTGTAAGLSATLAGTSGGTGRATNPTTEILYGAAGNAVTSSPFFRIVPNIGATESYMEITGGYGLGHTSGDYAVTITGEVSGAYGERAGLHLQCVGGVDPARPETTGYAGLRLSTTSPSADWRFSVGADTPGAFEIKDNNADETRLSIAPTTGLVETPFGLRGPIQDNGGQVFNVKALGAEGDGSTDDTTAIQAAVTAAAAVSPSGVVFFPPGTYNTSGGFSLNGLNGLKILGSGPGSTVIRITHASNDLFSVGATVTSNLEIGGFTVTSDTVTRTGGWVFHVNNAYNGTGALKKSKIHDLEITKQVNGLGIKKYEFVTINDSIIWDGVGTSGRAVQFGQTTSSNINQGSEARCRNVQVYGNDLAGSAARYAAGFWIEDCDAVELEGCGTGAIAGSGCVIQANASGHPPSNHFFYGCIFDATDTGHCLHMTGGGNILNVKVNATWFASAGQMAGTSNGNGLRFDAAVWAGGEISGCNFYNTRGTGLFIDASAAGISVTGNSFNSCGLGNVTGNNDGIYVDVSLNSPGPVICGNFEGGAAPGSSIKTSATANRLVITGNAWLAGTDYGVAPNVNANNGS